MNEILWCGILLPMAVIAHRLSTARPLPKRPAFADLAACLVNAWCFALLWCLSGRILFTVTLTVMLTQALWIANKAKMKALRDEPLVITDVALAWQVIRFPGLYLPFLPCKILIPGGIIWSLMCLALWIFGEPAEAAYGWWITVALPPALLLLIHLCSPRLGDYLLSPFHLKFDPRLDAEKYGPLGAAILHLIWHISHAPVSGTNTKIKAGEIPEPVIPPVWGTSFRNLLSAPPGATNLPNIFLVQAESFCDPRRYSSAVPRDLLKNWDNLTSRGQSGAFRVRDFGAYTLRTEFTALTGLPPEALGTYAFYPYLAALKTPVWSMACYLRKLGYRTVCLHPFHREFFFRHRAIPNLGFQEFVTMECFPKRDTCGPYISDRSVADAMTELISENSQPVFCFAITMESHGPWLPGRFTKEFPDGDAPKIPGLSDSVCRYLAHVKNADAMMGMLAEGLSKAEKPGIMALYGDHLPNLPDLITGGETATPYIVWRTDGTPGISIKKDIRPEEIGGAIFAGGWK